MFGDIDGIGWDLGNPDGDVTANPGPFTYLAGVEFIQPNEVHAEFHPMKGPMQTQSLRGLKNHGSMHWRGDRTGGVNEDSAQPDDGTFDERAAFGEFNGAFPGLLGRHAMLSDEDMEALTDFVLEITYPPNPIRALDNSLNAEQAAGFDTYMNRPNFEGFTCHECHPLDPDANAGFTDRPGVFGGDGFATIIEPEPQRFKIPHLRNLYARVGRFGLPDSPILAGSKQHEGEQLRGYGILHDGSIDTVFRFIGNPLFVLTETEARNVEQFVFAFDTNMAPIVGQQITFSQETADVADARVDLLVERANADECDLVVKSSSGGYERGWLYVGAHTFVSDRMSEPAIADGDLRDAGFEPGQALTYTCAPPGAGVRLGIDRDLDGALDGDERDAGSDPADRTSMP